MFGYSDPNTCPVVTTRMLNPCAAWNAVKVSQKLTKISASRRFKDKLWKMLNAHALYTVISGIYLALFSCNYYHKHRKVCNLTYSTSCHLFGMIQIIIQMHVHLRDKLTANLVIRLPTITILASEIWKQIQYRPTIL